MSDQRFNFGINYDPSMPEEPVAAQQPANAAVAIIELPQLAPPLAVASEPNQAVQDQQQQEVAAPPDIE